jgi:hypothetical protein
MLMAQLQGCRGLRLEAEAERDALQKDWRAQDEALQAIWGALGIDGDPADLHEIVTRVEAWAAHGCPCLPNCAKSCECECHTEKESSLSSDARGRAEGQAHPDGAQGDAGEASTPLRATVNRVAGWLRSHAVELRGGPLRSRLADAKGAEQMADELLRLRERISELEQALSEAAMEINCAGPVAHRIRVLREGFREKIEQLEKERDTWEKAARALKSLHDDQATRAEQAESQLSAATAHGRALQHRIDKWAEAKMALDAARPDFTSEQLRNLEAQEALLLSLETVPARAGEEQGR